MIAKRRRDPLAAPRSPRLWWIAAALVMFSSCVPAPVPLACVRRDLGSVGPEQGFVLPRGPDAPITLHLPAERIDVALTLLPPLTGPIDVVQTVDGQEIARWSLTPGDPQAISTRCSIGFSPITSTCGPTIGRHPHVVDGQWTIEPGDNRLLEAGLSVRVCH